MNKILLTYLLLIFQQCNGQTIYCLESDLQGKRFIVEIDQNEIKKIPFRHSLDWSIPKNGSLMGINIFEVAQYMKGGQIIVQYKKPLGSILEVTSNDSICYFIEVDNESDRFSDIELKSFDYNTNVVNSLVLEDSLNFSHILLSPKGTKLSFISHSNTESQKDIIYFYCIYDFSTRKISFVDTALDKNDEWFGSVDDKFLSVWVSEYELFYYRKDNSSNTGMIYSYDSNTKQKNTLLAFPEKTKMCFSYKNGNYYFIDNNNVVYSIDKHGNKKEWYIPNKDKYLQQQILVK